MKTNTQNFRSKICMYAVYMFNTLMYILNLLIILSCLNRWTEVLAAWGNRTSGTGNTTILILPRALASFQQKIISEHDIDKEAKLLVTTTPVVKFEALLMTNGTEACVNSSQTLMNNVTISPLPSWNPAQYPAIVSLRNDSSLVEFIKARIANHTSDQQVNGSSGCGLSFPNASAVDQLTAGTYFSVAFELLRHIPPHRADGALLTRLGIDYPKIHSFDLNRLYPEAARALLRAPDESLAVLNRMFFFFFPAAYLVN